MPDRFVERGVLFIVIAVCLALLCQCGSPIPDRPSSWAGDQDRGGAPGVATSQAFEVELLPSAPADAVPPVVRITVRFRSPVSPSRALLVAGELTPTQLREFAKGTLAQTVQRRQLRVAAWRQGDPTVVVITPLDVLQFGQPYTVAIDEPPTSVPLRVAEAPDPVPLLRRTWPPLDGAPATADRLVYCGAVPLGPISLEQSVEPSGRSGTWKRGIGASFDVPACAFWTAATPNDLRTIRSEWPQPLIEFENGAVARLEPAVLTVFDDVSAAPPEPVECVGQELPISNACAEVQDDRIIVRPPDAALLWAFERGSVQASAGGKRFVVRRSWEQPDMVFAITDRFGQLQETRILLPLEQPRSHVAINEVYADAFGPEPAQEWIELVNDGAFPVALGGYSLDDSTGVTVLPPAELNPGQFTLVAADSFQIDDGVDPPVEPSVPLIRVRTLGTHGLSNSGEALALRDANGQVVSRFPAMAARTGVSNARVAPDALDEAPESFARSPNGTATPGAPNGF